MASYPTAEEISKNYDFTGKTVLVTGANTGIGKETARVLLLRNAHVILGSRSVKKGEEAREDILKSVGQHKAGDIEVMELDLSSLAKVRQFADRFAQRSSTQMNYLINNAGIYAAKNQTTEDGFEQHFGVNHLAHFLLTLLLLPYLKASQPARIINVASDAHAFTSDADPSDVNLTRFKGDFTPQYAYAVSKVYNILFSDELNHRLAGTGVISSSLHPGLIVTDVGRNFSEEEHLKAVQHLSQTHNVPILSIPQGAATTLYATGDPATAKGGEYYRDCTLGVRSTQAQDIELGKKLWAVSEELAHIHFN